MEPLTLGDNRLETQTLVAREPKRRLSQKPQLQEGPWPLIVLTDQGRRALAAACREHHSNQDQGGQLSDCSSLAGLLLILFA